MLTRHNLWLLKAPYSVLWLYGPLFKIRERESKEGFENRGESSLSLDSRLIYLQISFGAILTPVGLSLLAYGFGAFFQLLPGSSISSIMLIYGFPLSLLGFALSYAQLKPVPLKTTQAAYDLRDLQMTDIQKQVRLLLGSLPKIQFGVFEKI